jgi:hypothetical protein
MRMPTLKLAGPLTLLEVRDYPPRKLTLKLENKSISYYSFMAIDIDIAMVSMRQDIDSMDGMEGIMLHLPSLLECRANR